jgi:disulfide bond formation protein DsbB
MTPMAVGQMDRAGSAAPARPIGYGLVVLRKPRLALALIGAVAATALAGAFVLQWGFGVEPCILCLYQRVPYALVAVIAGTGAIFAAPPIWHRRLLQICAAVFATGGALAIYHFGIENQWWASIAACEVEALPTFSVDDLNAAVWAPRKPCDEVGFRLLGLSLAGWNAAASAALAGLTLYAARRGGWQPGAAKSGDQR